MLVAFLVATVLGVRVVAATGAASTGPAAAGAASTATLQPNLLFGDNAVLQRDAPLPVWGRALPGEQITVALDGLTATATADTGGMWLARLPAHAAGGPFVLVVAGTTDTVRAQNVLIGDVWLCSGQSNMAFKMRDDLSVARDAIAAARDPAIRQFLVPQHDLPEPQRDFKDGGWVPCSPVSVGDFSAVGYFFARELKEKTGVPIGIINASVGRTKAEKWIGGPALSRIPELKALIDSSQAARARHLKSLAEYQAEQSRYMKAVAESRSGGASPPRAPLPPHDYPPPMPSGHYNAMIAPLIPAAIRGIAWYQGESNADDPGRYRTVFPLLITSWRDDWGDPGLPFLFVQLANYAAPDSTKGKWAELRDVQTAALSLPRTGMAVAIDVGESHDIHPKDKQTVGHRLALIAEALVYGLPVEYSGPTFRSAARDGPKLRISFDHAGGGLTVRGRAPEAFEVAGDDAVFHPAQAAVSGGDAILLWSDEVRDPREVRYAWADDPVANLYNAAGLPARPFRARVP